MAHYDVIVIGAGAMGSATAYYLSNSDMDILLLEQYELRHNNGSTHGESRVIRRTYAQSYFAEMMGEAYDLWHALEVESGLQFYRKTGGIDFGSPNNSDLQRTIEICKSKNIKHEILENHQLRQRYPAFNFEDDSIGLYQEDTGIVNPERTLEYLHMRSRTNGVIIQEFTPVLDIIPGKRIQVRTTEENFSCNKLVLTTGSWVNTILHKLGISLDVQIWHLIYGFFEIQIPELYKHKKFPVFINWDDEIFYGFPLNEKENMVKIAPHLSPVIPKRDLHGYEIQPNDALKIRLSKYVKRRLNSIYSDPTLIETCYYTMTSNENFIIDFLPNHKNIIIAAGFSGHGFKFTPLIGKILSDIVLQGTSKWMIEEFKIDKFI